MTIRMTQIPRTVWLRPEQLETIQQLSKELRISQASLMREGFDIVIAKYKKAKKGRTK